MAKNMTDWPVAAEASLMLRQAIETCLATVCRWRNWQVAAFGGYAAALTLWPQGD